MLAVELLPKKQSDKVQINCLFLLICQHLAGVALEKHCLQEHAGTWHLKALQLHHPWKLGHSCRSPLPLPPPCSFPVTPHSGHNLAVQVMSHHGVLFQTLFLAPDQVSVSGPATGILPMAGEELSSNSWAHNDQDVVKRHVDFLVALLWMPAKQNAIRMPSAAELVMVPRQKGREQPALSSAAGSCCPLQQSHCAPELPQCLCCEQNNLHTGDFYFISNYYYYLTNFWALIWVLKVKNRDHKQ